MTKSYVIAVPSGYGVSPQVTTDAIKVLRQRFGTRLLSAAP